MHICSCLFGKDRNKLIVGIAGLAVVAKVALVARRLIAQRKQAKAVAALEHDVVHIFMYPRWSRGPSFSSPCLRLEAFLRLARIPYQAHFTRDTIGSPAGTLPYMLYNGQAMADSEFIAQWATKQFGITVDDHLTQEQHAVGLAVRRLLEGSFQFGKARMNIVDNKEHLIDVYAAEFKYPKALVRLIVGPMRKKYIAMLNGVGHGDLTDEQYKSEMVRDIKAVEVLIGSKPYLLGDKPTSYDCKVYGALQVPLAFTFSTPEYDVLRNSTVLMKYVERLNALLFPDMAALVSFKGPAQKYDDPIVAAYST